MQYSELKDVRAQIFFKLATQKKWGVTVLVFEI